MAIELGTPGVAGLSEAVDALREWQHDGAPMQLHPGDLGWFWRFGAEATAAAVRTWTREGQILALGLQDSPTVLRLAIAPDAQQEEDLAQRLFSDITHPDRGVLRAGMVKVDAPSDSLVQGLLTDGGWSIDEPWTPLRRNLATPVPDPGVRIEVTGPERVHDRTAVQRAAFERSTSTEERWHTMAAGPGRPALLEPLGVHRDHRGHGYGTAISVAAAAALQELGSSSAMVCTPTANVAAVAAYRSAGFRPLPEIRDRRRDR